MTRNRNIMDKKTIGINVGVMIFLTLGISLPMLLATLISQNPETLENMIPTGIILSTITVFVVCVMGINGAINYTPGVFLGLVVGIVSPIFAVHRLTEPNMQLESEEHSIEVLQESIARDKVKLERHQKKLDALRQQ